MWSQRLRRSVVNLASPGQLFEDLGITYIGVVPGHDIHALLQTFQRVLELKGPVDRPRANPEGPRVPARRGGPGLVPRRRAPADGARAAGGRVRRHGSESRHDLRQRDRSPSLGRPKAIRPGSPHGAGSNGDALSPPTPASAPKKPPNYTAVFVSELIELARADERDRRDHRGHADRHRPVEVPGGLPGSIPRRWHRRAARRDDGQRARDRRDAPGRGAVLHVPPARLRPDRPRRLPERPAGAARGRSGRARRRGRHLPPGHVRDPGAAPAAVPRDREPEGRAGAAVARPDRHSRRSTRSRSTTRAIRASGCRPSSRRRSRSARREVLREGDDILFVGFGPIAMRAVEVADRPRRRRLVDRRRQRAVREAARSRSSSSTRRAASGSS